MPAINPNILLMAKGKTAAVLTMKEYRFLMKCFEDLEDILEIDLVVATSTHFRDYQEIRSDLKTEGKL